MPRMSLNTKIGMICHRVIGEVQRLGHRPVRNAQMVQSHRHQSAVQEGLCRGLINLFRNRPAILVAQFKTYHSTYVIQASEAFKLCVRRIRKYHAEEYIDEVFDKLPPLVILGESRTTT